jgi:hypothetical protein
LLERCDKPLATGSPHKQADSAPAATTQAVGFRRGRGHYSFSVHLLGARDGG